MNLVLGIDLYKKVLKSDDDVALKDFTAYGFTKRIGTVKYVSNNKLELYIYKNNDIKEPVPLLSCSSEVIKDFFLSMVELN